MEPNKTVVSAVRALPVGVWSMIGAFAVAIAFILFPAAVSVAWLATGSLADSVAWGVIVASAALAAGLVRKLPIRRRFGALWDRDGTPYCPRCFSALMVTTTVRPGGSDGEKVTTIGKLECAVCRATLFPRDDHGNAIPVSDLKRLISQ